MNLTFSGFLKGYCRELSGLDTSNVKKLLRAADGDAPRTAEPLFLWAASADKLPYLLVNSEGTWMEDEYRENAELLASFGSLEDALRAEAFPPRYQSAWTVYQARRGAARADRHVNDLMRKKTLDALQASGTTCYRLCKDLNLNKGNVYAYLNKGDSSKVSRATARRIMDYALSKAEEHQQGKKA